VLDGRSLAETGLLVCCFHEADGKKRIEFYKDTDYMDSDVYPRERVSTLLHELVHAYLGVYSCYGYHDLWEEPGKGFHGKAFLDVAIAVSRGAAILLGLQAPPREACTSSLACGMLDGGTKGKVFDDEVLASWGITREDMDKQLESTRGSEKKRFMRRMRRLKSNTSLKLTNIYFKLTGFYEYYKLPHEWIVVSSE
jgi:hypothetical protein